MIDHIGLCVSDYERAKAFYAAALAPLAYALVMEVTEVGPWAGFGVGGKPDFWIGKGTTAPRLPALSSPASAAMPRPLMPCRAALAAGTRARRGTGSRPPRP